MKAIVTAVLNNQVGETSLNVITGFYSGATIIDSVPIGVAVNGITNAVQFQTAAESAVLAYAASQSYGVTASDIIWTYDAAAPLPLSFANPARTLNSAYQISTTRNASVSYAVDIACTLSLVTGQQGTVYLEYADDSGFTTNVVEVNRSVNGNTGSLTIGLNLTQNATCTLAGMIPAGKYARLRTQNNTGTPTFTFRRAQEVLL